MRLKVILCGVTASAFVLLLAGCGMDEMSTFTPNTDSPAMTGRAFAGQQPVVGARIEVVEMGTTGYGSAGTVLATTTTDNGGNFTFAPTAYTCPQSNTPVYLLGIGGNSGGGTNAAAVLGAGLGACANGRNAFVIMDEVTTVGLAFTLAHFFSTTATVGLPPAVNDSFGGPSTTSGGTVQYSKGLVMGNNVTIPTIVFNAIGAANQTVTNASGTTYTVEWQKINTIANILVACVNTNGSTAAGSKCGTLFTDTQDGAAARPADTLQAAVQMALHPVTNVTALYNLITTTPAFVPQLTSAPHDWTIGVSYTTSALGLGVNAGTLSTLDIDTNGRVWFPSNAAGKIGAAYFDPASLSFNGPFNSTTLAHPQQVAIDANGYAWYNDSATGTGTVAGYLTTAPSMTQALSLPNTTSTSLTIGANDGIYVGVTTAGPAFQLGNIPADRGSYTLLSGLLGVVMFAHPSASIAGDTGNGTGIAASDATSGQLQDYLLLGGQILLPILSATNANSGQVVYTTGINYISALSAPATGSSTDALCDYQDRACNTINVNGATTKHAVQGMAVDGSSNLWVSESANGGVLQIPVSAERRTPWWRLNSCTVQQGQRPPPAAL